jgi:hypothetical protein
MDEADNQAILAMIDKEIAESERATRLRILRFPDDKSYANREWNLFDLRVAPLRAQRDAILTAMARVKGFEAPSVIIPVSTPSR